MKKILITSASFYPSFKSGGPVRSLCNLLNVIDNKYSIDVISADRDLGDVKKFDEVVSNKWQNNFGKSSIFYMSPKFNFFFDVVKVFQRKEYHILYLNSFFDYGYTIRFLLLIIFNKLKCKEIYLAPRGELTEGAMSIKKIKKLIYLFIFKCSGLRNKVTFHFTSEEELIDGLAYLGNIKYKVIPNMHEEPPAYQEKHKVKNKLNLLFLSRVSEKKNLLTVLKSLHTVNKKYSIRLTIVGDPDSENYWSKCLNEIEKLPDNIDIIVKGALNRELVYREFSINEAFILPTLNENYGHSIVEAMINSNIVIISDQTPWSGLSSHGGLVGKPFDSNFYSNAIQDVAKLNGVEFNRRTLQSYSYCHDILSRNEYKIEKLFE